MVKFDSILGSSLGFKSNGVLHKSLPKMVCPVLTISCLINKTMDSSQKKTICSVLLHCYCIVSLIFYVQIDSCKN